VAESVNIQEAKTHFSRLVMLAETGEEVVITRAGRPVARLVPFRASLEPRTPGLWRGRVTLAADFDDPTADLIDGFSPLV
jgi:prevent-host-death family protein